MVSPGPREFAGDKLLRALIDDPDDDAACLVLADWLTERGDPRGNLIMLQHQRASQDSDVPLRDYIAEHADQLLGPIRDLETNDCHLEGHWRYGFISRLAIGWKVPRDSEPFLGQIRDADSMRETLEAALSHATTQLLGELTLAPTTSTLAAAALAMPATSNLRHLEIQLHDWTEISRVVKAIAACPRQRLASLTLGHASYHDFMLAGEVEGIAHEDGPFVNAATLRKLTTATPALRELRLAGGRLFKGLDHPTLRARPSSP